MTVETQFAVSWKPLMNSKYSAKRRATASSTMLAVEKDAGNTLDILASSRESSRRDRLPGPQTIYNRRNWARQSLAPGNRVRSSRDGPHRLDSATPQGHLSRSSRHRIDRRRARARDGDAHRPRGDLHDRRDHAWRRHHGLRRHAGRRRHVRQPAGGGAHDDHRVEDEFPRRGAARGKGDRRIDAGPSRPDDDGVADADQPGERQADRVGDADPDGPAGGVTGGLGRCGCATAGRRRTSRDRTIVVAARAMLHMRVAASAMTKAWRSGLAPRRSKKNPPMTATPSARAICCTVDMVPAAIPASRLAMRPSTVWTSGDITSPWPKP